MHTPTPWENDDSLKVYSKHVIRRNGLIIATLPSDGSMMPLAEKHANARLIAAAPALLAACEKAQSLVRLLRDALATSAPGQWLALQDGAAMWDSQAKAALALAKGE